MDSCKCTVPDCSSTWLKYGYVPGCQTVSLNRSSSVYRYDDGIWYSLPGSCPSQDCWTKDGQCRAKEPGGRCGEPNGDRSCTWHLEPAGEIRLDELSGISDLQAFCKAGNKEFVPG